MVSLEIDKTWTLFLDRDGVINHKRENDYVKNWNEFYFINGSLDAISYLSKVFGKIIIVTNQRGVGRGIMKEEDLILIHEKMLKSIKRKCGKVDKIYYATDLLDSSEFRKPNTGMANKAKLDFPSIEFGNSIMIGDSKTDMIFGKRMGMTCFMVNHISLSKEYHHFDMQFDSLFECSNFILNQFRGNIILDGPSEL